MKYKHTQSHTHEHAHTYTERAAGEGKEPLQGSGKIEAALGGEEVQRSSSKLEMQKGNCKIGKEAAAWA